jgi:hypothetical protein
MFAGIFYFIGHIPVAVWNLLSSGAQLMPIIDYFKRRLHREIVADPVLHGLVLNLYLNGEQYPHRVDDYFPIALVESPELAALMRQHCREEDKHVALYAKAVEKLEQPVLELPMRDIFNAVIRGHTRESFAVRADQSKDERRLRLAHFLAHAHTLEKRVARSLEYHLEACAKAQSPYPEKAVGAVLADEYQHVQYTGDWVRELLPKTAADAVFAHHAEAEAKANLDFSATQLSQLLQRHQARFPRLSQKLYGGVTRFMRWRLQNHG